MGSETLALPSAKSIATALVGAAALAGLFLLSRVSYVLFHSVAEIATISVGLSIFFLTWNSRPHLEAHYLLLVGISSLFVSGLDTMHALEYKGMGVFPGTTSNKALQLWIIARLLQAGSLVLALAFLRRKAPVGVVFGGFVAVCAAALFSLYVVPAFPDAYLEGTGATPFMLVSEIVVMVLVAGSLAGLLAGRPSFDPRTLRTLGAFLVLLFLSELSLTLSVALYGPANVSGHLVRLAAYYFLYRGIVVTGLRRPYDLLYRDLARSRDELEKANVGLESQVAARTAQVVKELADRRRAEDAVRESRERYKEVFENVSDALFVFDVDGEGHLRVGGANPAAERLAGTTVGEAAGRLADDVLPETLTKHALARARTCVDTAVPQKGEIDVALPGLGPRRLSAVHLPIREGEGAVCRLIVAIHDITERTEAERLLRESEQKFRTLAEQSMVGIAMIEEDRFVFVNERLAAILGYSRRELEALEPETLFPAEDLPLLRAGMDPTDGRPGAIIHSRVRGRHRDGSLRSVELYASQVLLRGTPTWIGVVLDITEQLEREAALASLISLHRALSRANVLIVHEKDRGRLLQEICRICVQDGGAVMTWVGHLDPVTRDIVPEAWAGNEAGYLSDVRFSTLETPFGQGPAGVAFRENRHVVVEDIASAPSMAPWREQAVRRGYHSCAVFPLTADGAPVGVIATYSGQAGFYVPAVVDLLDELAMDVSYALDNFTREEKRARAVELVRESNERFRELTDSIREAFWMTNIDDGRTLFVSKGYEEIWQIPRERLFADPDAWLASVHPEDRERVRASMAAHRAGQAFDGEYRILRPDGSIRWVHDRGFPVRDRTGRVIRVAGLAEDITAAKEAEEALRRTEDRRRELEQQLLQSQKLESLGTLASGVAHDFNNLLAIILGHAYLLDEEADPRHAKGIHAIMKAADRGTALVRQLLTIARKTDMKLGSIDLNEVVAELARLLRETFPKTITIRTELQEGLPVLIADGVQIHQVLMNLCINARDAMPGGGVLSIATSRASPEDVRARFPGGPETGYIRVRVSDTGVGMDEQTQRRMYEPFFTTKAPGKGTGLGLSLVHSIVERHRGSIDLASAPGAGTRFDVFLPVASAALPAGAAAEASLAPDARGRETILLVEDEEGLREALTIALAGKGYMVVPARDGEEGVDLYRRHHGEISLVLCDYGLPKLDGAEVARRIRLMDPRAKVVLTSGEIDPARESAIAAVGAAAFLKKPFRPLEAIRLVRSVIDAG